LAPQHDVFRRVSRFMVEQGYRVVGALVGDGVIELSDGEREVVVRVVDVESRSDELMSSVI